MLKSKSVILKHKLSLFKVISLILILMCTTISWPKHSLATDKKPENTLNIVKNGVPKAILFVTRERDENIKIATKQLVEYIQKSTGAVLQVKTDDELAANEELFEDMVHIFVGFIGPGSDPHIQEDLEGMNYDGFIIRPHGNSITIIGPSTWGTRFGVSDFLERYVGVRWLMPGEDGEDVPRHENISVPRKDDIMEEPAFMMRRFSPITPPNDYYGTQEPYIWAYNNQTKANIEFGHNIWSLFPVEEFGVSHPEFYPIKNGVRYIPPKGVKTGWQPCFAEPETVTVAVNKIIKYFDENPNAMSFSLGTNDSGGFCEGTHPENSHIADKINSVGEIDMSDIYYKWVNAVVTGVREKYPDKWFGLLAYSNVADAPSFKLDPHIVPFITKDRMTWIDQGVEVVGKEQIEKWNEVSDNIGLYDYIYGLNYAVPRVYPHLMGEYYRYAKENGVSAHYAEIYPNWGEGPKAWIAAKLLWDPYQDVDTLLNEWYERAVGAEAAPYLKQYYDYWENFWCNKIKDSIWFETYKNQTFLQFSDPSYLNMVTKEDISISRELMENVLEKAQTPKEKARAQILYRVFEYYEASALSYPRIYDEIKDAATALSYLQDDGAINTALSMAIKREEIINREMAQKPYTLFNDPRVYPAMKWNGLNSSLFFELSAYMKRSEAEGGPVVDRVLELAKSFVSSNLRDFARLLIKAWKDDYIISDPSFELGQSGSSLKPGEDWEPNTILGGESNIIKYDNSVSHTGITSVRIENIWEAGPAQKVPVNPGLTTVSVHYYSAQGNQTHGSMVIICDLYDENKQVIKKNFAYTGRKYFKDTAGEWIRTDLLFDIPEMYNNVPVKYMQVYMDAYKLDDGVPAYIDDVYVYQGINTNKLDTLLASIDKFIASPDALQYTASSLEVLKSAIAKGKLLVMENIATSTQDEVDMDVEEIKKAFDGLVPIA